MPRELNSSYPLRRIGKRGRNEVTDSNLLAIQSMERVEWQPKQGDHKGMEL
jgi:hypothetical protein